MMAAAAPSPAANGGSDAEKGPPDERSPSRFTPVNGKEPVVSGPAEPARDAHLPSVNQDQHREGLEDWRRGGYNTPPQPDARLHENDGDRIDRGDGQTQRSPSRGESPVINTGKRKRSDSDGHREIEKPPYRGPSSSEGPAPRFGENVDSRVHPTNPTAAAISHDARMTEHSSPPDQPRNLPTDTPWQEHSSQYASPTQHSPQIDPSDANIADALQRGAQDADQNGLNAARRVADGAVQGSEQTPQATYPRERSQGAVQVTRQRKRTFTNRTKTGCLTCRKRKKKCDEQHPECNNCLRGGFDCEGYSSGRRLPLQRPQNTRISIPLQSKEGYSEVGGQYIHDLNQQHGGQRLSDRPEMGKIKSIIADEGGHATSQYGASPTDAGPSHGPWLKRNWAGPGHPGYLSEYVERSGPRDVTLIHEVPRGGQPNADYPVVAPLREPPYVPHSKPGAPLVQGGIDGRLGPTNNMDASSPQAQARMALNIEHQLSAHAASNEETEKDKMIRGELYQPFDIHLVEERARCKAALWRFNNACNGISGASAKEQNRLLKEVLVPPPSSTTGSPSGVASPRLGGSMGQGAILVAPFECHYGYNIHIGEDVMVSESCRFVDDCPITIGAHTWIGPAVTILSSMAHTNMQERKGSQSRYQGRAVTIEEDCYIGANCTIYPGVRIRRGAYIAPGEVVKTDIVAYGFQGFKPNYM